MSLLRIHRVNVVFSLLFIIAGCSSEFITPTSLSFGLTSYSNMEEVKSIVKNNNGDWKVIESSTLEKTDLRPPYSYVRIVSNNFFEKRFPGKTNLIFFNDRLMTVLFYPNDWSKYEKYLYPNQATKKDGWKKTNGNLQIRINRNYNGDRYISWEDIKLSSEMRNWIAKYS